MSTDLHTGNVAYTLPGLHNVTENDLIHMLGKPEVGTVRSTSHRSSDGAVPKYVVRPSGFPYILSNLPDTVKIVDFGESFFDTAPPATLRTPLAVRAPEVLLEDRFDHRADLWSMACLVCTHMEVL